MNPLFLSEINEIIAQLPKPCSELAGQIREVKLFSLQPDSSDSQQEWTTYRFLCQKFAPAAPGRPSRYYWCFSGMIIFDWHGPK